MRRAQDRSAKRDDQIARPRRAQACERSELRATRMCPRSGQIFIYVTRRIPTYLRNLIMYEDGFEKSLTYFKGINKVA